VCACVRACVRVCVCVCDSSVCVQPRRDKIAADVAAGRATINTRKANKSAMPAGKGAALSGAGAVARKASCAQQDGPDLGLPVVKGAISLQKFNTISKTGRMRHNMHEKIIHFVRHAEGHHNVAASPYERSSEGYIQALKNFKWYDARLSSKGEEQCRQLATESGGLEYQIILVSPLTRALQTATLGFPPRTQQRLGSGGGRTNVGSGDDGAQLPVWAYEPLRERFGRNPCDHRRNVTELQVIRKSPSMVILQVKYTRAPTYKNLVRRTSRVLTFRS
jgi:hypothetical protein